jgi:hypothetical protein
MASLHLIAVPAYALIEELGAMIWHYLYSLRWIIES